jgi:hypothetical protein
LCSLNDWNRIYWPSIGQQINQIRLVISKSGIRLPPPPLSQPPQQQPPATAASPLVSNPVGVPVNGKHSLRQEDLHIPESRRRHSGAPGPSASPASIIDPASVPPLSQTPITVGTPAAHPGSTPANASKRPSTDSPAGAQLPPNKVQIGVAGPIPTRDEAQDEAIAMRRAKEREEELAREEARKDPLEYAKNAMYKAVGKERSEGSGVATLPQPVMRGLADQVQRVDISEATASGGAIPSGANREKGQKGQLPSPPWSGTITPRQLRETFANTTDIEFALRPVYPFTNGSSNTDDLNGLSIADIVVDGEDGTEQQVNAESNDFDYLSPLGGEFGWDDAYSWTKNLQIPWNGDISNIIEQSNNLGVVA